MEKLLHPFPDVQLVDGTDAEAVTTAMLILHHIGWNAQQGITDRIFTYPEMLYSVDPEILVRACAQGSSALHKHLGRKVREP